MREAPSVPIWLWHSTEKLSFGERGRRCNCFQFADQSQRQMTILVLRPVYSVFFAPLMYVRLVSALFNVRFVVRQHWNFLLVLKQNSIALLISVLFVAPQFRISYSVD